MDLVMSQLDLSNISCGYAIRSPRMSSPIDGSAPKDALRSLPGKEEAKEVNKSSATESQLSFISSQNLSKIISVPVVLWPLSHSF